MTPCQVHSYTPAFTDKHTHLYTKLPQKCQSERVIVAFVLLNIRVTQKGGPWRSFFFLSLTSPGMTHCCALTWFDPF